MLLAAIALSLLGLILIQPCADALRNDLPVIDIDALVHPDNYDYHEIAVVLDQIKNASSHWGFFNIVNHGISQDLQDRLFHEMKLFFDSPRDVKDPVRRNVNNSRGYADLEYTKQRIDRKEVFDVGPLSMDADRLSEQGKKDYALDGVNYWPDIQALPNFEATVAEYYNEVHKLAMTVLRGTAYPMRCFPFGFFDDKFDLHTSLLRLNHYPVNMEGSTQKEDGVVIDYDQLGVGHHTDAGGITVLLQDLVGGLQVYTGTKQINNDGEWVAVPATPGSITVNIGDMLQVSGADGGLRKTC